MGLIVFFRAMEQWMVTLFNQKFGPCANWFVICENILEVQNELIRQVSKEFQYSHEWLIERFDTITMTLDVQAMEIDSVPEPVNFVALIQAAVNEGFAWIALDTKVAENAWSRQAFAFLQAKREYRKLAKATCNPSWQISRSILPMLTSFEFREYTVNLAVVDRVAILELQLSRLNAPPTLTTAKGKTAVHSGRGWQSNKQL